MTEGAKGLAKGKVYIVGAGPGDPELLTVRARRIIEGASVVVHDALVSSAVLSMVREGALIIDAGKRRGKHRMEQDEINDLLVRLASEGKDIVRLKGGDPFVFGRGAEEALHLRRAGIEFEVIPGLSSALAGPSLSLLPLTVRGVSDRILIMSARGAEGAAVSWDCLNVSGQTIVFMMGISSAAEISSGLISRGMRPETPAAIILNASLGTQRVIVTDLLNLGKSCAEAGDDAAGLIVVGETVNYMTRLADGS
ncbi:MAG: uroporphyrinogen-III C-methyltransferase [Thermoplasmata archaeon]|uniref:uroporphyrinogen-III C-methyltransferase n=1 Tax=Candidatus Sysuiplasma superficiale TaxID=2823368 RepID=A0A8J7YJL4_9ARCH|nr:uroporphyrinogen-III C-methyltransferase [Candidatus Sysuiplasma superficiale]MBX8643255.1 uroporphyrinogen-III C-methyltransferase [Candidatus Sysuiplasma superficiale]MCL4346976.1 uroporphyrinogen-III C-methyltransferase [Candidatus Thermoplasmatota archaeon]MCL5437476.1 uroporphyrinogen-III C-methyltransferase [Candidatus Thermoplasmatota archaeon]